MKLPYILCSILIAASCTTAFAEIIDSEFSAKVWETISALPEKDPSGQEKFVDINPKRVVFPHTKHQTIISELGYDCSYCHHEQKGGKPASACRHCHAKRQVESKGKYAKVGQKLDMRHIYHFFCGDCHKEMIKRGSKKCSTSSPVNIPSKCHHCHVPKSGNLVDFKF